jgi:hypothetical protein
VAAVVVFVPEELLVLVVLVGEALEAIVVPPLLHQERQTQAAVAVVLAIPEVEAAHQAVAAPVSLSSKSHLRTMPHSHLV